ncbi:hypothetical protein Agub_g1677, partial [Astrephomene gubernaculifera]
ILLLVYYLSGVAGQSATFQTYAVDWTEVPADPPTTRNLTAKCTCDLREDACDLGCCCDTMCPTGLTSWYTSEGVCLPQQADQQTLTYCMPSDYVYKVNLPASSDFYTIVKDRAEVKFFSELLCIVSDSNPNLGATYPDPPAGAVGDNVNLAQCPAATSPPSKPSIYQFRNYIYVQPPQATSMQPLTVPYPAFSSECNDQYTVGFLLPVPAGNKEYYAGCQRDLAALNLSSACSGSGLLTAQYYSGMHFQTGTGSALGQPFTLGTVQYLNSSTGELTTANSTAASYNASTGVCSNIVRYINMTVYYSLTDEASEDAPGYIDKIEVSFVLTDVLSSAGPLEQGVRVSWLPTATPQPIDVVTSGNPGYITGFPLLAGTLATSLASDGVTTKSAISRMVSGLPLPAPGPGGACSPAALQTVKYGVNTSSTCSVSLNATQLMDFCTTGQSTPQSYVQQVMSSLYGSVVASKLYLGEWGDSDYNNVNQWLQVQVSGYPFNPSIFSTSDQACSGVITGFDLQIVTGVAFSSNNLQQKVLYANLCFKTGVWDFPENVPSSSAQRFYLQFNVSFIRLPQQAVEVKKPAPPLVVPLPADIFYPFVASESAENAARASPFLLGLIALIAILVLQLLQTL